MGRQTLREALARLRDAGYVVTRRGRNGGAVVQEGWGALTDDAVRRTLSPGREALAELSDLRCLVESMIARTAAERRGPDDIATLRTALEAHERATGAVASRRADHDLHNAVVTAAGNQHLAQLSRELLARVNVGLPIEPHTDELHHRAVPQHRALVEAVIAGDADAAAAIARDHFTITHDALNAAITRAG